MPAKKPVAKATKKQVEALAQSKASSAAADFAPPLWGHRYPGPLVPQKTGDAALDAALAAFAAEPTKFALYKKLWKLLKPEHAKTLFAGSMLDRGRAYEPTAAELATLDKKARRARYRAVLDFSNQTPRGQLFVSLADLLLQSSDGRAHLLAIATDKKRSEQLRSACASMLVRPELDEVVALGKKLLEVGWHGDLDTQPDDAFGLGVTIALRTDPASAKRFAALLSPPSSRGVGISILRGIRDVFSDYSNVLDELTQEPSHEALAPLVAPLRALLADPEYADDVQPILAVLV